MIQTRYLAVIALFLLFASRELPLALAEQERPRRVFTNEDIESAPSQPPTPAPEETPAAPEPAEPPAAAAEAPASEENPQLPASPEAELKLAEELRRTLDRYVNYYPTIAAEETDPNRKSQMDALVTALMNLIQQNTRYIGDLQRQVAEQQAQAPSQP